MSVCNVLSVCATDDDDDDDEEDGDDGVDGGEGGGPRRTRKKSRLIVRLPFVSNCNHTAHQNVATYVE